MQQSEVLQGTLTQIKQYLRKTHRNDAIEFLIELELRIQGAFEKNSRAAISKFRQISRWLDKAIKTERLQEERSLYGTIIRRSSTQLSSAHAFYDHYLDSDWFEIGDVRGPLYEGDCSRYWGHSTRNEIICFHEGDITTLICEDAFQWTREIERIRDFHFR